MEIPYKCLMMDTIYCISENYIKKCVSPKKYKIKGNKEIHQVLYNKIKTDVKDMLINDIKHRNTVMTDTYIYTNNVSMSYYQKAPCRRVIYEIVQYDIENIRINKDLLDNFSRIFKYLVDKYLIEYYNS